MRHADNDLFNAQRAAALDDLLQRGNHGFAPVEAESFRAGEFQIAEFLEAFSLDQLVEDGALALAGETDLLVGPFDALLDPGLLRGVGDMHELDPERLAISAADDRQDFAQGAELEPKHPIKKDRPVVIAVAETVRSGIEILLVTLRLEPKRIEMGMKVPARPIRANEHQRANGVACRLLHFGGGEFDAGTLRARLDLVADSLVYLRPAVCAECGCEIVARNKRPVGALPGRPACGFPDR